MGSSRPSSDTNSRHWGMIVDPSSSVKDRPLGEKADALPQATKVIKIFLATPGDLTDERLGLAALIKDINVVLTFLAPEKRLFLELLRYETHTFPDVGLPQNVINRQIPPDYDVLIGAMWSRCGTPTKEHESGSIEEFWRAYEHRQTNGSSPVITFYFCDQLIPIPSPDELRQLEGVVAFREKVTPLGYFVSYQSHEDFREVVRTGLLRAIRSILQADPARQGPDARLPLQIAPVDGSARQHYLSLASEYDQLRAQMPAGNDRTRLMTNIFSRRLSDAAIVSPLFSELQSSQSAGQRLGAIAILHMLPNPDHLDWLAERLDPRAERPFIGYQAAAGLLQSIRNLPNSDCSTLRAAIGKARALAERNQTDTDRLRVLDAADRELASKCGPSP
jgi:hypothetical protein